ncbi:ATP-dependent RNA helicase DDX51 [Athalia rosae]|uniref:ATP-dependent RNA helicase DDX51 n=1 Tax=Athalia rosae TaxID=37344 RepID=UPI002033D1F6|nr:ATP-dependent RNA helicase DDX51 [Athalia rosae]
MSIFTENRYKGDEDVVEDAASENHLTALLKKIKERKKRKSTTGDTKNQEHAERFPVAHKKSRKHLETSLKENVDIDLNNTTHNVENQNASNNNQPSLDPDNDPAITQISKSLENIKDPKQDFIVLGSDSHKKKTVVKRVLPDWLADPVLISADLNSGPSLSEFNSGLDDELIKILKKNGVTKLFPVQASVIPFILKWNEKRKMGWWAQDICISSPTGSGKTLAVVLPVIQHLQHRFVPKVRCLVVLPGQELAAQIYTVMTTYTAHTDLKVVLLSGLTSLEQEQIQLVKKLASGELVSKVDIVVTTPGRLIDHIKNTPGFSLTALQFIIIDEADRPIDWLQHLPVPHSGSIPLTVGNLMNKRYKPAQKLLCSATLSQDPEKLSKLNLIQPKLFTSVHPQDKDQDLNLDKKTGDFAGRYTSPDELKERTVECQLLYKPLALVHLLTENETLPKMLVFMNSGQMAHRLALLLGELCKDIGLTVAELSSTLTHNKRKSVLTRFAEGNIQILVSTDALARGMDIPGVNLVVSYDMPKHIKGYIHRSGRTGRAGNPGTAVSLVEPKQVAAFTKMLSGANKVVPNIEVLNFDRLAADMNYEQHVNKLKETLSDEKTHSLKSLKAVKRKHSKISKST